LSTVLVIDPATTEVIADVTLSEGRDVDRVIKAAVSAWCNWRRVPACPARFATILRLFLKLRSVLESGGRVVCATATR